ncbi:MAG: hypothetical protein WC856_27395 [Methylococcaceae bacterium]|jgi:hypothetical protein
MNKQLNLETIFSSNRAAVLMEGVLISKNMLKACVVIFIFSIQITAFADTYSYTGKPFTDFDSCPGAQPNHITMAITTKGSLPDTGPITLSNILTFQIQDGINTINNTNFNLASSHVDLILEFGDVSTWDVLISNADNTIILESHGPGPFNPADQSRWSCAGGHLNSMAWNVTEGSWTTPTGFKGENVTGFSKCTPFNPGPRQAVWGQFGPKQILEANSGEKLEIQCVRFPSFPHLFSYVMFYTSPDGLRSRVGMCPFLSGCNVVSFFHSGDNIADNGALGADHKPDRILLTRWISKDYGFNDRFPNPWTGNFEPLENYLDWAESIYDVRSNNLTKKDHKYEYNFIPALTFNCPVIPKPEGKLVQTTSIDPPLGAETEAFFDQVVNQLAQLPASNKELVMFADRSLPCDLDGDGDCNAGDKEFFQRALGACEGSFRFRPEADADGSGCIDAVDQRFFFDGVVNIDIKPGSFPNYINPKSKREIPVAILTTDTFNATTVDPLSVKFGPHGAREDYRRRQKEDIDLDGDIDIVLYFRTKKTGIKCGDTSASLKGKTYAGKKIIGFDSILTVGLFCMKR